ncbi:hypothetical protein ACFPZ0_10270 [Streptomonospora nanhaiensis]|uniref:Uncharacterized protein n=1 Tax=Streptomonospora nanhaiensis TaxID=1323731 RepID=A0A853BPZ4_9ACTN|nr:hypothetical protein [Streptomonospora nanhaiensis]MBV2364971.1 hypothetical protein [Streptomonospora nanhaiensis]MBX9389803.1 hypothetical protein [Streptomonospora nanhaiensis]NYI97508.1 hypothetical protein [Streptomonospora nanhaiensis]
MRRLTAAVATFAALLSGSALFAAPAHAAEGSITIEVLEYDSTENSDNWTRTETIVIEDPGAGSCHPLPEQWVNEDTQQERVIAKLHNGTDVTVMITKDPCDNLQGGLWPDDWFDLGAGQETFSVPHHMRSVVVLG